MSLARKRNTKPKETKIEEVINSLEALKSRSIMSLISFNDHCSGDTFANNCIQLGNTSMGIQMPPTADKIIIRIEPNIVA